MKTNEEYYELGDLFYKQRNYLRAASVLEEAARSVDCDADCLALLAQCYACLDRTAEAIETANRALGVDPDNDFAHRSLSYCLSCAGKYKEALEPARVGLKLNPDYAASYATLASALIRVDSFAEAISVARDGLEIEPTDNPCLFWLAEALVETGEYEEAIEVLDRALIEEPNDDWVHESKGWAYLWAKRFDEAKEAFQRALLLDPSRESILDGIVHADCASNPIYYQYMKAFITIKKKSLLVRALSILFLLPMALHLSIAAVRNEDKIMNEVEE